MLTQEGRIVKNYGLPIVFKGLAGTMPIATIVRSRDWIPIAKAQFSMGFQCFVNDFQVLTNVVCGHGHFCTRVRDARKYVLLMVFYGLRQTMRAVFIFLTVRDAREYVSQ